MILLAFLSCFLVVVFFQIASFQLKANHCVFERVRSFGILWDDPVSSVMCIPVICVSRTNIPSEMSIPYPPPLQTSVVFISVVFVNRPCNGFRHHLDE